MINLTKEQTYMVLTAIHNEMRTKFNIWSKPENADKVDTLKLMKENITDLYNAFNEIRGCTGSVSYSQGMFLGAMAGDVKSMYDIVSDWEVE